MKHAPIRSTKLQERTVIEHLRSLWPSFPRGTLIASESPDFIVRQSKGAMIGLELTSIKSVEGSGASGRLAELLRYIIAKKDEKLVLYRQTNFRELWLVVSCDYLEWPQSEHPQDFLQRFGIESRFTRIILFDLFQNKVIELR